MDDRVGREVKGEGRGWGGKARGRYLLIGRRCRRGIWSGRPVRSEYRRRVVRLGSSSPASWFMDVTKASRKIKYC